MAFHLRRQQRTLDTTELTPISEKRPHSQISSAISSHVSKPSSRPCNTTKSTPRRRQHRTKAPSAIELLPTEILANIFSYTCNLNFPRASPILATKLTGEHIYHEFCKRLFCSFELPALPLRFVRDPGIHRYRCYSVSLDEEKDLVRYRTMALTCRWMTLERFKRYRNEILTEEKACQEAVFSAGSSKRVVCIPDTDAVWGLANTEKARRSTRDRAVVWRELHPAHTFVAISHHSRS